MKTFQNLFILYMQALFIMKRTQTPWYKSLGSYNVTVNKYFKHSALIKCDVTFVLCGLCSGPIALSISVKLPEALTRSCFHGIVNTLFILMHPHAYWAGPIFRVDVKEEVSFVNLPIPLKYHKTILRSSAATGCVVYSL